MRYRSRWLAFALVILLLFVAGCTQQTTPVPAPGMWDATSWDAAVWQ